MKNGSAAHNESTILEDLLAFFQQLLSGQTEQRCLTLDIYLGNAILRIAYLNVNNFFWEASHFMRSIFFVTE